MRLLRTVMLVAAAVSALPGVAGAHHFNRGHFVRAFAPCEPGLANAVTSSGIPACAPAVLLSDCATDPDHALRLATPSSTSFTMMPTGRRHTRKDDGQPTIEARFGLQRVSRCDGTLYDGTLTIQVVIRIQRNDPACATGRCTLPDTTFHYLIPCTSGRCASNLENRSPDLPPLPLDHGFTIQVVRVSVLDLAGQQFLNIGMALGAGLEDLIVTEAEPSLWERVWTTVASLLGPEEIHAYGSTGTGEADRLASRFVQAFAPCDPGQTDTTTADGRPACSTVVDSDCASDPDNAVIPLIPDTGNFIDSGKGKLDFAVKDSGDTSGLSVRGAVDGLKACSGNFYTGLAGVQASVRATLLDSGCAGGTCTTIPTTFLSGEVQSVNGQIARDGLAENVQLEMPDQPEITAISAEIIGGSLIDASGNAFMFGPAWLVRCNLAAGTPNQPGGHAFCFGN